MKGAKKCMKSSVGIFSLSFFVGVFFLTPLVCLGAGAVLRSGPFSLVRERGGLGCCGSAGHYHRPEKRLTAAEVSV